MMKKSIQLSVVCFLGASSLSYAQEGRVGINTETPSATLNVKSKSGNTNTTKNLELENSNGVKMLTVLDNGFVGINNATPSAPLHILTDKPGMGNNIIFEDYNNIDPTAIIFNKNRGTANAPAVLQNGDFLGQFIFSSKEGNPNSNLANPRLAQINAIYKGTGKGSLSFSTSGNGRMSIGADGNVKIGDIANDATNLLHIVGENPLRLEGLRASTNTTDKTLVVGTDGVVKLGAPVNGTTSNVSLLSADVNSRYTDGPIYKKTDLISGTLYKLPNSELTLNITSTSNFVSLDWNTVYVRVDGNGKIIDGGGPAAGMNFPYTLRIYKIEGTQETQYGEDLEITAEYIYQDTPPAVFRKALSASYATKDMPLGTYRFELYVGKATMTGGTDNTYSFKSTKVTSKGFAYQRSN